MTTEELMKILSGPPRVRMSAGFEYPEKREHVVCADGFRVSIQASSHHYCAPLDQRHNDGGYDLFELGYPNQQDDFIQPFAESPDNPTQTVYGFVPYKVVEKLIEKHGGPAPECDSKDFGALSHDQSDTGVSK